MLPSKLLVKSALAIVVGNHLSEAEFNDLEEARVTATHADPDDPYIELALKFKDQDNIVGLHVGIEEFDNIPFARLHNALLENEKKDDLNITKWIETGMYDVEDIEILSCEKCKFPTIHRFDYCPNCGRKIINNEGE